MIRRYLSVSSSKRSGAVSESIAEILKSSKTLFIENEHVCASNGAVIDTISPHNEKSLAKLSDASVRTFVLRIHTHISSTNASYYM